MFVRFGQSEFPYLFIKVDQIESVEWGFDERKKDWAIELHKKSGILSRITFTDSRIGKMSLLGLLYYIDSSNDHCYVIDLCEYIKAGKQKIHEFAKKHNLFVDEIIKESLKLEAKNPIPFNQEDFDKIKKQKTVLPEDNDEEEEDEEEKE